MPYILIGIIMIVVSIFLTNRIEAEILKRELTNELFYLMTYESWDSIYKRDGVIRRLQSYGVLGPMGFNEEVYNNIVSPEKPTWRINRIRYGGKTLKRDKLYKLCCKLYVKNHINYELVKGIIGE